MKNKENSSNLGDAMNKMFSEFNLEKKVSEAKITQAWGELMGNTIAAKTEKIFIRNGKLFLTISSAPLKHQMTMQRSKIIRKIEDKFGEGIIEEVIIR